MGANRRQSVGEVRQRARRVMALLALVVLLLLVAMFLLGANVAGRGRSREEDFPTSAGGSHAAQTGQQPEAPAQGRSLSDQLRAMAEADSRFAAIAESADEYPQELLELALKNSDAVDFAAGYPEHRSDVVDSAAIDLEGIPVPGVIPLLMQWDSRWGYGSYGSGLMGLTGCGPTCLSMVILGLTGNTAANPLRVAEYSDTQGWYLPGYGSDWELMRSGAEHYGLQWQELPLDENAMRRALENGQVIIASMAEGDFTYTGHFIVLSGYDSGVFRVLDPNSYSRSARTWSFETLHDQINGLWAYWV